MAKKQSKVKLSFGDWLANQQVKYSERGYALRTGIKALDAERMPGNPLSPQYWDLNNPRDNRIYTTMEKERARLRKKSLAADSKRDKIMDARQKVLEYEKYLNSPKGRQRRATAKKAGIIGAATAATAAALGWGGKTLADWHQKLVKENEKKRSTKQSY